MKTLWIDKIFKYDGTQLRSLYSYLEHGVLGPSCVAWRGPCQVDFSHMVDGEDLLAQATIAGEDMVHFIIEIFDTNLMSGILWQRLLASLIAELVRETSTGHVFLRREGDDLYFNDQKFSISIATESSRSVLVHFAVNVSQKGTPVKTVGLEDLKLEAKSFAQQVLNRLSQEYASVIEATYKVRSVL